MKTYLSLNYVQYSSLRFFNGINVREHLISWKKNKNEQIALSRASATDNFFKVLHHAANRTSLTVCSQCPQTVIAYERNATTKNRYKTQNQVKLVKIVTPMLLATYLTATAGHPTNVLLVLL